MLTTTLQLHWTAAVGDRDLTVTLDVSTKLLFKCFRALFASSSDLNPTKPNLRNLPSLVNLREQSVTVPKAANIDLNLSSFICMRQADSQHDMFRCTGTKRGRNYQLTPPLVTYPVREVFDDKSWHDEWRYKSTNEALIWFLIRCQQTSVDSPLRRHVE